MSSPAEFDGAIGFTKYYIVFEIFVKRDNAPSTVGFSSLRDYEPLNAT